MILSIIIGAKIPFDSVPVQESSPREYKFNREIREALRTEVSDLLKRGMISVLEDVEARKFASNIFAVPKPNGKKSD